MNSANSAVVAAIIAASVSLLTLIGTLVAQYLARRATSKEMDRTLAEQRSRTLNERFATAVDLLGSDQRPAVRLAGVYAMAGLADDWEENRQTCVNVLCAYLRMPYEPDPRESEVRHTVIREITAHLQDGAKAPWQRLKLDFTGAIFDGGDFSNARFLSGGEVSFRRAKFCGGKVSFGAAEFSGGEVHFNGAEFSGSEVNFSGADFPSGGRVYFNGAEFSGGKVSFSAEFSGAYVSFSEAKVLTGGEVSFSGAKFSGGKVYFNDAQFSDGEISFSHTKFLDDGKVDFAGAKFSGSMVTFFSTEISGSEIDFSNVGDWSHPPTFDWDSMPPSQVKMPAGPGASRQDTTPGGDSPLPGGP
jgi:uncharacterized protein YjbI with pentapeptide repeats